MYVEITAKRQVTFPPGSSRLWAWLLVTGSSGLVAPLHGEDTLAGLAARTGCGLLDRLIAEDYRGAGLQTLTLDRKMAALPETATCSEKRERPTHVKMGGGFATEAWDAASTENWEGAHIVGNWADTASFDPLDQGAVLLQSQDDDEDIFLVRRW